MTWLKTSRLFRYARRVWSWLLGRAEPGEQDVPHDAARFKVIHPGGALLRSDADLGSTPITMLPQGQVVQGLEERGRRARVRLSDGTQAWLSLYEVDGTPIMRRLSAGGAASATKVSVDRSMPRAQSQDFREEFEKKWQRLRVDADGLEARPHRLRDGSMGIPILRWRPASQPQPNPSDPDEDDWPLPELEPLDPPPKPLLSCQQLEEKEVAEPEDLLDISDPTTVEEADVFTTGSRLPSLVTIFSTQDRVALDGLQVAASSEAQASGLDLGPATPIAEESNSTQLAAHELKADDAQVAAESNSTELAANELKADDAEQQRASEASVFALGGGTRWDSKTLDRAHVQEAAPCRWNTASSVNTVADPWATAELRMKSVEGFTTEFSFLESIVDAPGDSPVVKYGDEGVEQALDALAEAEFDGDGQDADGDLVGTIGARLVFRRS